MTDKLKQYKIQTAQESQKQEILALYRTMIGGLADWNEYYPSMDNIEFDMARDNLFVMMEGENIIATISIDEDDEVKILPNWSKELEPAGELSRLCVRRDKQNQGIARVMMEYAFEQLRNRGYRGVHILVRKGHEIALQSYSHLGYQPAGNCILFEKEFLCFERAL